MWFFFLLQHFSDFFFEKKNDKKRRFQYLNYEKKQLRIQEHIIISATAKRVVENLVKKTIDRVHKILDQLIQHCMRKWKICPYNVLSSYITWSILTAMAF